MYRVKRNDPLPSIYAIILIVIFIIALVLLGAWANGVEEAHCRALGGTPVYWHNEVQCIIGGGVALK